MSGVLAWEDPPAKGSQERRPARFNASGVARDLRGRLGCWALVAVDPCSTGLASLIKGARFSAFRPAGSFEATTRVDGLGRRLVFARYVGESS